MRFVRVMWSYIRLALTEAFASRVNFYTSVVSSLIGFTTGVLGIVVVFSQTESLGGWSVHDTLLVLGAYLIMRALKGLFLEPSMEALAGMDGEVWTGRFDYTLLKPVPLQFHVSVRRWRPLAVLDLVLAVGVTVAAITGLDPDGGRSVAELAGFVGSLAAAMLLVYAMLLLLASLVFLSPGFMYTWLFNAVLPAARFPLSIYPGWVRFLLTWVIPLGLVTTIPAQAARGTLTAENGVVFVVVTILFLVGSSFVFARAVRRYTGASA